MFGVPPDRLIRPPVDLISPFIGLTQLRGFWPLRGHDVGTVFNDYSLNGLALTATNTSIAVYNSLVPYVDFNGTTAYATRADEAALDITGDLTLGGWFWADALTAIMSLITKSDLTAANDAFRLEWRGDTTGDPLQFTVGDGATTDSVAQPASGTQTETGRWYFVVARYTPSTEIALFVNYDGDAANKFTNTSGIPAALVNSASAFRVGGNAVPSRYLDGRGRNPFLCAAVLDDAFIASLFHQTRVAFGV